MTDADRAAPVQVSVPVRTLAPTTIPSPTSIQRTGRSSGNAMPPYSTSPTPATVMMKAANSFGGRYSMISHSAGSATAAVSSRVRSRVALHRAQPLALELGARASEAPLPLLEECQRLEVLALAEVGPQRLRDVHLGVGELPEEEVA